MSRSGYSSDDCEQWSLIMYRGAVTSAIHGARGQAFLKEMLAALDALPERKLIADELITGDGAVCAIGAVGKARGVDMSGIDLEEPSSAASVFGIATALAAEIVYMNDEGSWKKETPEARYSRMRQWVASQIRDPVEKVNKP